MTFATEAVDPQTLSAEGQAAAYVVIGITIAISGYFANRAARRALDQRKATQVPSDVGDGPRDPGIVLASMEKELHQTASAASDAARAAEMAATEARGMSQTLAGQMGDLKVGFARLEERQAATHNDVERIMRRIYGGDGHGG